MGSSRDSKADEAAIRKRHFSARQILAQGKGAANEERSGEWGIRQEGAASRPAQREGSEEPRARERALKPGSESGVAKPGDGILRDADLEERS